MANAPDWVGELPDWVAGSLRPSMLVTWLYEDDTVGPDLSGATITATIAGLGGTSTRAAAGDFTVTDGPNGVFRWDFDAADLLVGRWEVQFNAAFGSDPTPAITFLARWWVRRHNVVS